MKAAEKIQAQKLRFQGWSLRAISKQTGCSKSTISNWIRDIPLTDAQIKQLKSNQDRSRAKAANHPNSPKTIWANIRNNITCAAEKEISGHLPPHQLKLIGISLYWAEGGKAGMNLANFSNSDPAMIKLMMAFFRRTCKVPDSKFRGVVYIHPHLDIAKAERFWSRTSSIPLSQFHHPRLAVSKASRQKRDTLPLGTFRIFISDTRLQTRIKGWIKGLQRMASGKLGE